MGIRNLTQGQKNSKRSDLAQCFFDRLFFSAIQPGPLLSERADPITCKGRSKNCSSCLCFIDGRESPACVAPRGVNGLSEFAKAAFAARTRLGRGAFFTAREISAHQHVSRRIVLPIVEEFICLPQCQPADLSERPSGSGSDVPVDKRPVRYTDTGIGSPAAARLSPETSRTAWKRTVKSSKVSPFSSCSAVRSRCTF